MIVHKRLASSLSTDEYLVGVVEAQLQEKLVKPRGRLIVKKLFIGCASDTVRSCPTPGTIIGNLRTYVWDFNHDELLVPFLRRVYSEVDFEIKKILFDYFELHATTLVNVQALSRVDEVKVKLNYKHYKLHQEVEMVESKIEVLWQYYSLNKNIRQISTDLFTSAAFVKKTIKEYRKGKLNYQYGGLPKSTQVRKLLLNNADFILSQFQDGYCLLPLEPIRQLVCDHDPNFELVPRRKFEDFVKGELGIKFRQLRTIKKDIDSDEKKDLRRLVSITLLKLMYEHNLVVFFDESLISESSFRTKAWRLRKTKYVRLKNAPMAGTVNILFAVSATKVWNYWICSKVNQHVITSFLQETVLAISSELGPIAIYLLLDNCPTHKTNLMKHFAESYRVFFIYNCTYSSKINAVEYFFEIIKRTFRSRVEKNRLESIYKTVHTKILEMTWEQLRSCFHRAFEAMADCIDGKDMWV